MEDRHDIKNVTARALSDKSFLFTTSWSFLNRPTNIDISSDFIVCDLSNVPESLKNALNVFVTGLMGLRFRTNTKKGTIIMVDEAAVFLKNPQLSTFLLQTVTQGRSFDISLWLATQQPSDLQKVNLKEEFHTNMPLAIVLGNMRSDTVDIVKSFFKLDKNATDDLLNAGVGEGLLLIGEEKIPIKFKPTTLENDIIKGHTNKEIAKLSNGISLNNEGLFSLISENGFISKDWVLGDDMGLSKLGYEHRRVQKAIGNGLLRVWLKKGMLIGDMIRNQSIDHYSTVLQIAGYLVEKGIPVTVNHLEGSDVCFEVNGKKYFLEYEAGTQSPKDLQIKKQNITDGQIIFVCNASNLKYLYENIGEESTVKRGKELTEFLDGLIEN